jgi:UDP-N-acetylglucosamine 2-epimerase (non-hydrolysing)
MNKILVVFGTRPEAVKLCPLILELSNRFDVEVCVTGQHREMLYQVLRNFEIEPTYDLELMTTNQTLNSLLSKVISGIGDILNKRQYDLVIVQGDTASALGGGLAAFNEGIKIAHIEAGLRTGDLFSPFPEEANRILIGRIASYHMAPTVTNKQNLLDEGINDVKVAITGNTVIDALMFTLKKQRQNKFFPSELNFIKNYSRTVLVTAHRRENLGPNLINICKAIKTAAMENIEIGFVYPVHKNPKVRSTVFEILGDVNNVHLIEPLDYQSFVFLMNRCYFIITDSGGVQEEAPALNKPVLVIRKETERQEGVDAGCLRLVGVEEEMILDGIRSLLCDIEEYSMMAASTNPYGDGSSSKIIANFLRENIE